MDWWTRTGKALALAAIAALSVAAPAAAVDTIYWADQSSNEIRYAPADGSNPAGTLLYAGENAPDGIALDPATGRIYWASEGTNEIRTGLLSGTSPATTLYSGEAGLDGLAVDPVNGRIYWASGDILRGAPLGGGGTVESVYPPQPQQDALQGVAADVAGGLLYWTLNGFESGNVMRGPFGGGGEASLYGPGESGPSFVAVDSAANGVWWTTVFDGIRAGTPGGAAATTIYNENFSEGIAADTAAGRLYWVASMDGPSEIHSAPIAGGGAVSKVADGRGARGIALLRTPLNTVAPLVSPTSGPSGTVLSCTQGTWSIGVPGAFLYRAPTSFAYQWHRNGTDLAGETSATHTAASPGTYTCTVTATNQAGSTAQLSSNEAVIADPEPGPAPPIVTLTPEHHDFGTVLLGDEPTRRTFTVMNLGGSTATLSPHALTGPHARAFNVVSNQCGGQLAAGASCDIEVAFGPASRGSKDATLEIRSDGGDDSSTLAGVAQRPPVPAPIPADLDLLVANDVVLHKPRVPTRCRTSRRTRLRRCGVQMFTLGGKRLGTNTQGAGTSQSRGKRTVGVQVPVNRRGRRRVAPALGGVPVKLRAVGRLTDGRRIRARNRTRLFAERHYLEPPAAGIFVADKPILLPSGRRFLLSIADRARRVDVIQCDGHAAELPFQHVNPVFAATLAVQRAHVACNFLRRHGMNGRFVKIGHSNRITRVPRLPRTNPRSWPPDRRTSITLIRH